jgi:hypothetical protein
MLQETNEIVMALRSAISILPHDAVDEETGTDGFNNPWTAFVIDLGLKNGYKLRAYVNDNVFHVYISTANDWVVGPQFAVTNPTGRAVSAVLESAREVAFYA